ncbi:hypothetical protein THYS13_14970 [Thermoanaerobacter sp. YS13]|uniref:zinc finger-like domain-containing protein n=1 Tax=Thermoanaerobacter sp. YS13 TaxID=1511746 RepID=UPI000574F0FA|nr:zinc finger-like domain-containing protein [Thermoanaerobacter sp. YS13]KHO63372.1 hypothetical protein THYS13_14970 [Thermoanaerobacter sp. YS13]
MLNLLPVIKEIKKKIEELEEEKNERIKEINQQYEERIQRYSNALLVIQELNEACEYCEGTGKILPKDSELEPYYTSQFVNCPVCLGTGRKIPD